LSNTTYLEKNSNAVCAGEIKVQWRADNKAPSHQKVDLTLKTLFPQLLTLGSDISPNYS
jgi:hypothetical protein